ncbi:MAG TPA: OmpA family protein [Rhodocyclaceae bacterium]|jgi:outer membrane protein OmpA-like peptidoglycan-associated protein|nr:OmpA family protein [Rhodocyclaceae bacterium]
MSAMPFFHLHSRLSLTTLLVPFASLLLAACATTGSPNPQQAASNDDTDAPAYRTGTAKASFPEFNGPQIVFAPESSDLPDNATQLLDEIAAKLKADPQANVVLIGHTEDMGSSEMSIAVSGRCARAVSLALIKRGAKPMQIRTLARGNDRGLLSVRKAISRVDIVVVNSNSL